MCLQATTSGARQPVPLPTVAPGVKWRTVRRPFRPVTPSWAAAPADSRIPPPARTESEQDDPTQRFRGRHPGAPSGAQSGAPSGAPSGGWIRGHNPGAPSGGWIPEVCRTELQAVDRVRESPARCRTRSHPVPRSPRPPPVPRRHRGTASPVDTRQPNCTDDVCSDDTAGERSEGRSCFQGRRAVGTRSSREQWQGQGQGQA